MCDVSGVMYGYEDLVCVTYREMCLYMKVRSVMRRVMKVTCV